MAAFNGGPPDGLNPVYRGHRVLELRGVTFPSSQAKKDVTVAYVREGDEQYLPGRRGARSRRVRGGRALHNPVYPELHGVAPEGVSSQSAVRSAGDGGQLR